MSTTTNAAGPVNRTGQAMRLPAPTRDRRPALAALAVLLILGGGLVSGLIAFRSGERSDYLVVRRELAPGQQVKASDLGVARIAGSGASAIPAEQRARVVGTYATGRIYPGTLLNRKMLEAKVSRPNGSAIVGVQVDESQAPAGGVRLGDVVSVLAVPSRGGDGDPVVLVRAARVVGVGAGDEDSKGLGAVRTSGGSLSLSLLVRAGVAAQVAAASAQGQAALLVLPPTTAPEIG